MVTRSANVRPSSTKASGSHPRLPKVLVTGFDPFGGETVNPSWQAAHALHRRQIAGHLVVAASLPTAFGQAVQRLDELLQLNRPALVVCVGQAGGRSAISLERVAINVDDARIPDNTGAQPVDEPVVPGGPAAYFSTLPIKAMLQTLQQAGIAAEVSQTAGTFVCNHVFYGLMHLLATRKAHRQTRGGFIHVPYLPEQSKLANLQPGPPSMPLASMVAGLRLALHRALVQAQDIKVSAGALQ